MMCSICGKKVTKKTLVIWHTAEPDPNTLIPLVRKDRIICPECADKLDEEDGIKTE